MHHNKSPHILASASNLLGFSLIVLTSINTLGLPIGNLLEKTVVLIIIILALSCMFSFASMRAKTARGVERNETLADYLFLSSLILISLISILVGFDYITFTH